MDNTSVTNEYLKNRMNVLNYTNYDMNLKLDNDKQVYIAVFDIPQKSSIINNQTFSLALIFGLNTHIYYGTGDVIIDLEKNKDVMKAMQSLFISSPQVLSKMKLDNKYEYYDSNNIRVYLKTQKGVYFREIINNCKEDSFIIMLMNNVLNAISKVK